LNKRITLQKQSSVRDTTGQSTITWTDIATVWAAVLPLRGREFFEAERLNSEISIRIVIRYRRDVEALSRVKYGNRFLQVQGVIDPEESHEELQIMCREFGKDAL
jgi:SPP1 family predicted phage head-tail adaptor